MPEMMEPGSSPARSQSAFGKQESVGLDIAGREELASFFELYYRPLVNFLQINRKQSFEDARDIAQEAFARLCAALKAGSGRLEVPYLYRIALNCATDRFRRRLGRDLKTSTFSTEIDLRANEIDKSALTDM